MRKILFLLIVLSAGVCGHAQIITIAIEATVRQVDDDAGLLEGAIAIDDIITGTYTYNTDTPDTHPSSTVADYEYYESPYGTDLLCNGLEFKTDPDNVDFLLKIINDKDYGYGDEDLYLFISRNNLPLLSGIGIQYISWQLNDYSGTAISSTALPAIAPILTDWILPVGLWVRSEKIGDNYNQFYIYADVTSAEIIPEPGTLILLGAGMLLLRKRKT